MKTLNFMIILLISLSSLVIAQETMTIPSYNPGLTPIPIDQCSSSEEKITKIGSKIIDNAILLNVEENSAIITDGEELFTLAVNIQLKTDTANLTLKKVNYDIDRSKRSAVFEFNGKEYTVDRISRIPDVKKGGKDLILINVGSGSVILSNANAVNIRLNEPKVVDKNKITLLEIYYSEDKYSRSAKFKLDLPQVEITEQSYTDVTLISLSEFFSSATKGVIVAGDNAAAEDFLAGNQITTLLSGYEVVFESEVPDPKAQNIIVIGGTYVNPLAKIIFNLDLQDFQKHQAIIRAVSFGNGKKALLVAGYSYCDTRNAAMAVGEGLISNINKPEVIVESTALTQYVII